MNCVNKAISEALHSDVELIRQVGHYIFSGGGKRLRPLLLVLAARACGCVDMVSAYSLAAVVEIIHTTSLLHDDVVDASERRRGQDTANVQYGNAASILVGDFMYSRAFQVMVKQENLSVLRILSEATNVIAEGEVLQLINVRDTSLTEEAYLHIIRSKTAKLFEASGQIGAILANASSHVKAALAEYGVAVGTAFQIVDDLLDFLGDDEVIGKNVGDDLSEGKVTLPLIYALRQGNEAQIACIRQAIETADGSQFESVLEIVESTGALDLARQCAERISCYAAEVLGVLSDSPYKQTLIQLPRFVVERTF